jgi:hypothetical protein
MSRKNDKKFFIWAVVIFLFAFYFGFADAVPRVTEQDKTYLKDTASGNKVGLQPPSLSSSWNFTYPVSGGTNNFYLKTDGSGNTSWNNVTDQAANKTLSNLDSPTSINQNLITSAGTFDLGSDATPWQYVKAKFLNLFNGANYISLKAPATLSSNFTYNLPVTDGTAGQVLTTDGGGNLSFSTVSGGGGGGGLPSGGIIGQLIYNTAPGSGKWKSPKNRSTSYESIKAVSNLYQTPSAAIGSIATVLGLEWIDRLGIFLAGGNFIASSSNGILWYTRNAVSSSWRDFSYSPHVVVALNNSVAGQRIATSVDGITWIPQSTPSDQSFKRIAYSDKLDKFVAVGSILSGSSAIMYSSDGFGTSWTMATDPNGASASWSDVVWSKDLEKFVIVGQFGTAAQRVATSTDGITWTLQNAASDNSWTGIEWSPELDLFVAVSQTGVGNRVMTSPDGITWTSRTNSIDNAFQTVKWSPELNIFLAISSTGLTQKAMTSPDGIIWTTRTTPSVNYFGLTWSPELGVFVASVSNSSQISLLSTKVKSFYDSSNDADKYLSNLASPTSVNQHLLPNANNALNFGSSAPLGWANIFGYNFQLLGSTSGTLTLSAASTTTNHTLTMPSVQGAADTFLKNNGSGVLSWASASVNYGLGADVNGSGCFTTSTTYVALNTGCITSATITTTGRPVLVFLSGGATVDAGCYIGAQKSSATNDANAVFRFNRDAGVFTLSPSIVGFNSGDLLAASLNVPGGSMMAIDNPPSGSHTYSIDGKITIGTRANYGPCKIVAIEL